MGKDERDRLLRINRRKRKILKRICDNLRKRVGTAIRNKRFTKKSKLSKYLGCTYENFIVYLKSLFQSGMTWDNYGFGMDKWNIDHKIPLASATTIEEIYALSHYTNLQPMWQPENIAKSDSMPVVATL